MKYISEVKNNNIQERLNGEFRDREKVQRSQKRYLSCIQRLSNLSQLFTTAYLGINTSRLAGIEVHGDNKWKTLIQNARLHNVRK